MLFHKFFKILHIPKQKQTKQAKNNNNNNNKQINVENTSLKLSSWTYWLTIEAWLFKHLRSEWIFFKQPRTYIYVLDAVYSHPFCLLFSNQRRIYTYSYCFACDQNIFMPPTMYVCVRPSCTSPIANDIYIRLHKVTFYRCLVVGCVFLWLFSFIYKLLDMEIMFNCNTNNQGRIYTSILQGVSKILFAEGYVEIHMLQFHIFTILKTFKILSIFYNLFYRSYCWLWACIYLLGWQFISYSYL